MSEQRIAVLGAGTMGAGIAQLAAQAGFEVLLYDVGEELAQRGSRNIASALEKRVAQGKLAAGDRDAALGRIKVTTSLDDASGYPVVVEAAPEDLALKREIFGSLGENANPDAVLASNTSSLSITSIASACKRPEQVVGMHFFNPAPAMPLVEVIAGARSSPDIVQATADLARALGKRPVFSADTPGFIVNRVARPFYGEAFKILADGSASVPQIDAAMRAAGFKMGPFELMDLIGIDINFAVTKTVFEAYFGESRYRPHPLQQRMVESGALGRKSGRGFYTYAEGERDEPADLPIATLSHLRRFPFIPPQVSADFLYKAGIEAPQESSSQSEVITRILSMIINEAAFAVGEGVASVRDVDTAMVLGTNYPSGPLRWADRIGLDVVLVVLQSLQTALGDDRYRPAPLLWQLVSSGAIGDVAGSGFHSPGEKGMV
jgi:3-hydroxybutyryl-CoA dehydrogenase